MSTAFSQENKGKVAMQEQVFGYTDTSSGTRTYPPYVAFNKVDAGVSIAFRAQDTEHVSEITLPTQHCVSLCKALLTVFNPKEVRAELAAELDPFFFALGEAVELVVSGERGVVIARAQYHDSGDSYLVHYKAANGCATTQWFNEDYLELFFEPELPVDADIPMEPAVIDVTHEWKKFDQWSPALVEAAQ